MLAAMSELLAGSMAVETLRIAPQQAKLRSQLYEKGFIEEETIDEAGFYELRVKLPRADLDRILQLGGTEIKNHTIAVSEHGRWESEEEAKIA